METRRAPRVSVDMKIISQVDEETKQKFSLSSGRKFEARAVDISTKGIGMVCNFFFPAGLIIEMELVGKLFGVEGVMRIKGEIRYSRYLEPGRYRVGIKFVDTPSVYEKKISEFIATYETRREPRLDLPE